MEARASGLKDHFYRLSDQHLTSEHSVGACTDKQLGLLRAWKSYKPVSKSVRLSYGMVLTENRERKHGLGVWFACGFGLPCLEAKAKISAKP